MIDSVMNLLLRCSHRRMTRPISPVSKTGEPHGETYVVCLDCGKQFSYDLQKMQIGKPVHSSEASGVLHPDMAPPRRSKLPFAVLAAALPVGWLLNSAWTKKQQRSQTKPPEKS